MNIKEKIKKFLMGWLILTSIMIGSATIVLLEIFIPIEIRMNEITFLCEIIIQGVLLISFLIWKTIY